MQEAEMKYERRKQRRLERLGANNPRCASCGETYEGCLELHHVAGKDFGEDTVIQCRNCHRKLSDAQLDHPKKTSADLTKSEQIAHFLLGLADVLMLAVEKLREIAAYLIERVCTDFPEGGQR